MIAKKLSSAFSETWSRAYIFFFYSFSVLALTLKTKTFVFGMDWIQLALFAYFPFHTIRIMDRFFWNSTAEDLPRLFRMQKALFAVEAVTMTIMAGAFLRLWNTEDPRLNKDMVILMIVIIANAMFSTIISTLHWCLYAFPRFIGSILGLSEKDDNDS